jgi:hypothetical protein
MSPSWSIATNRHDYFVEKPPIAAAFQPSFSESRAESGTPLPNRLVRDRHAAFGQQVFDVTQTQGESMLEPDGMGNHVGWKPIAAVDGLNFHQHSLPDVNST